MKICVVIPTYNESKTIASLVRQIRNQKLETVVIDDGSHDDTHKIACDCGATVIKNISNEGKGASLIKGFNYCLSKEFDAIITMDGDGQHEVADIPNFLRKAKNFNSDIVIGNRMFKPKTMPTLRLLTNKYMSWLISKIAKQKIPDTQCGFRLIKKDVLSKLDLVTRRYEIESEMLIRAAGLGYKIDSVPIKAIYMGENSKIRPFRDALRFFKFVIREYYWPNNKKKNNQKTSSN